MSKNFTGPEVRVRHKQRQRGRGNNACWRKTVLFHLAECVPSNGMVASGPFPGTLPLLRWYWYRARGGEWFTIHYYRKDPPFLSLEVPHAHTHTPTRFEMPAARGKTSLNDRDW